MSALAVRRLPVYDRPPQPRLFALPGGLAEAPVPAGVATVAAAGPTLDEILGRAWSALGRGESASCLLCGGEVAPRWSAGAGSVGGRCGSCGTTLE